MLTIHDCEVLREAYSPNTALSVAEAMRRIGSPSAADLIAFACQQMNNPNRNIRVLMLRLLARQSGARAAQGVLAGLRDTQRRVCAVAIQACPNFLYREDITRELTAIATEPSRKRKLRRRALSMLAGDEGRWRGDLSPAAFATLARLVQEDQLRFAILFGLVRLDLAPRVKSLLTQFAGSGDDAESKLALRALAGELVVHINKYADEPARQALIMQRCDIAYGRMYYWIPREPAAIPQYSPEQSQLNI